MDRPSQVVNTLLSYLRRLHLQIDRDYLRASLTTFAESLMEIEVSGLIDASHYERNRQRRAYRNGYRTHTWQTDIGKIQLRIPKLRRGSYYPGFLEILYQREPFLLDWLQSLYIAGVTLADVETVVVQLGIDNLRRSDIANIVENLHDVIEAYRQRKLRHRYRYLLLDVVDFGLRDSAAIAIGVRETGEYDVLAIEPTTRHYQETFWKTFLTRLRERGLIDIEQVLSDDYANLRGVVDEVFVRADWRYTRAYDLRDLLTHAPQADATQLVEAISRLTINTSQPLLNGFRYPPVSMIAGHYRILHVTPDILIALRNAYTLRSIPRLQTA